ncbi:MAG: hypothetical protein WC858_04670 [Parcubacteria group bacterium]|jgi:hypothetical protein
MKEATSNPELIRIILLFKQQIGELRTLEKKKFLYTPYFYYEEDRDGIITKLSCVINYPSTISENGMMRIRPFLSDFAGGENKMNKLINLLKTTAKNGEIVHKIDKLSKEWKEIHSKKKWFPREKKMKQGDKIKIINMDNDAWWNGFYFHLDKEKRQRIAQMKESDRDHSHTLFSYEIKQILDFLYKFENEIIDKCFIFGSETDTRINNH